MNKYMGFFELKNINIPTVPWRKFDADTALDDKLLWTLRVAVESGFDFNLPRHVGVTSAEAFEYGRDLLNKYRDLGIVIYYPYFIADKSGVIDIRRDSVIVEAVQGDLWNLTTYGKRDVTVTIRGNYLEYQGDSHFVSLNEIEEIRKAERTIRLKFRDELNEGRSLIAEWSFAYNTDICRQPVGDRYLVFYELRSV